MIQILVDSLLRTCEISLLAVGLTMVYALLRFANFAHVEFATIGGFIGWFVNASLGAPLIVAITLAALASGFLGWAMDRLVFTRLQGTTPIQMMIASFGIGIVIRESVRAIWGPAARFYPMGLQRPLHFLGASMTPMQLWIVAAAILCMLGFHFLLNRTNLGIAMRATADDAGLAQACGIHTQQLIGRVWFIGSAFAALGGVMIGLETQISPQLGFGIMIPAFAAAILGGIGNP